MIKASEELPLAAKSMKACPACYPEHSMPEIADTPKPPYYAVIFICDRTDGDNGYAEIGTRMAELAAHQPSFLGI